MAARVAVGLVAVLALGWLAVMERDTRLQAARGARRPAASRVRATRARAEAAFRDARLLNPDTDARRRPGAALPGARAAARRGDAARTTCCAASPTT